MDGKRGESPLSDSKDADYKRKMFRDAFIKLDSKQAAAMTGMVNPHIDVAFDPALSTLMVYRLPFYKDHFFVELANHNQHPPVLRMAICSDAGAVYPLDWTNEPIFTLNKKVPITLNDETVFEYARFFFTYVRGKHGRFLIIDSVDDIDWQEEPAAAGRKALAKMIEPMSIKGRTAQGGYTLKACLVFKDSLFESDINVESDGHISLQNEELLVEAIPVADDLFGQ